MNQVEKLNQMNKTAWILILVGGVVNMIYDFVTHNYRSAMAWLAFSLVTALYISTIPTKEK